MKQHIKEIIVVEGKNDTNTLQSFFDCDTIETGGDQVNEKTIERVRQAQKTRGVIIFTDPDTPKKLKFEYYKKTMLIPFLGLLCLVFLDTMIGISFFKLKSLNASNA